MDLMPPQEALDQRPTDARQSFHCPKLLCLRKVQQMSPKESATERHKGRDECEHWETKKSRCPEAMLSEQEQTKRMRRLKRRACLRDVLEEKQHTGPRGESAAEC